MSESVRQPDQPLADIRASYMDADLSETWLRSAVSTLVAELAAREQENAEMALQSNRLLRVLRDTEQQLQTQEKGWQAYAEIADQERAALERQRDELAEAARRVEKRIRRRNLTVGERRAMNSLRDVLASVSVPPQDTNG